MTVKEAIFAPFMEKMRFFKKIAKFYCKFLKRVV